MSGKIANILIVGAGLSGMVLATALKKGGVQADAIEIHPKWDVLGVGISVQGPALRALRSIGLLEACVREGFGYSQVVNCDDSGRVAGIVELPRLNGPQYPSCVGIMRPVLHQVVADAMLDAGAAVRFGVTVKALSQTPEAVDVQFSDGSRGRYDLVVAADGRIPSSETRSMGRAASRAIRVRRCGAPWCRARRR